VAGDDLLEHRLAFREQVARGFADNGIVEDSRKRT